MMKNRNIKTHLSNGAHLCCGFVSVLSVLFGVISVIAQETEPANWIDSRYNRPGVHIVTNAPSPAEMAMQSNNVTVATDAKLALKIDETDGISTNLNLYSATVENKLSFSTAFTDAVADGEIAWDSDWMTFCCRSCGWGDRTVFPRIPHLRKECVWSGCEERHGCAVFRHGRQQRQVRIHPCCGRSEHPSSHDARHRHARYPARSVGKDHVVRQRERNRHDRRTVRRNRVDGQHARVPVHQYTRFSDERGTAGTLSRASVWVLSSMLMRRAARYLCVRHGAPKVTDLNDVNGTELTESGQIMVWDNTRKVFDFTSKITDFATAVSNVYAVPVVGGKHELWVKE